jgi:hypothetical protein
MTARPQVAGVDHFPDWATSDVTGAARVNNVVVPPAAWLLYGWSMLEKPARQFFNWFGRYTSLWLRYLDEKRGATIQKTLLTGASGTGTVTGLPAWKPDDCKGMVCIDDTATVSFDLGVPVGYTLTEVNVKWYNKTGNAQTPAVNLYLCHTLGADPTDEREPPTIDAIWTNIVPVDAAMWAVLTSGVISVTPILGEQLVLIALPHDADDCCSVHIKMTPPA